MSSYAQDFNQWTVETADLLRDRRWADIDVAHLIEEVQDLGKRERRSIESYLVIILIHLLKWQYQPQRRSDSWTTSINNSRLQIEAEIEDSPSLKDYPNEVLEKAYSKARRKAAQQTGLSIDTFPELCPYAVDVILRDEWLPPAEDTL